MSRPVIKVIDKTDGTEQLIYADRFNDKFHQLIKPNVQETVSEVKTTEVPKKRPAAKKRAAASKAKAGEEGAVGG